jgi:hypothetical protein
MPNNTLRAASGEIVNQHRNINSVLDSRLNLTGLSGVICRWPGLLWVFWHGLSIKVPADRFNTKARARLVPGDEKGRVEQKNEIFLFFWVLGLDAI